MDLLPKTEQMYVYGTKVVPVQPDKTQVNTSDGVWIFKGWSPQEIPAITADTVFVGTWQFGEYAQIVNSAPTIKAENREIIVGDTFDPMAGVTAADAEDGDLTAKIQLFSNYVDVKKPGVYYVVYKVVDTKGAMATETVRVDVKEKTEEKKDPKPTPSTPSSSQSQTVNNPAKNGQLINGKAVPQTGDYNNIALYAMCFVICGAILFLLCIKRNK